MARDVLDQIYKLYVRPHLDYGNIIYHKYDPEFKLDFTKRFESTQYSAALTVSEAWRGTNTDKLYEELGWEILYYRRWYRRLCHFYKLQNDLRPLYLYNEIRQERTFSYNLRRPNVFESSAKSTDRFNHTYFQNCVREWNQLNQSIRNCPTISGFKQQLVRLVRPTKKSTFGAHDIEGVRLLTRSRVQFSDLREHRFRHRFHCSSPMCLCQTGIEDNEHFLLHCPRYTIYRKDLIDRVSNIVERDLDSLTSIDLCNLLLYGNSELPLDMNHSIIESTITFIKSTKRFEQIKLNFCHNNLSPQSTVFASFLIFIFHCNIRAVCYLEQQRLDMLCHFSVALDIAKNVYVYFYNLIEKKTSICTTSLMLGEALSNRCFIVLRKEVPSLSLHNIGLFVPVTKRLLELVESERRNIHTQLQLEVRNYHNKLHPVSRGHFCADYLFTTILRYHLCLMSLLLAFSIWIRF